MSGEDRAASGLLLTVTADERTCRVSPFSGGLRQLQAAVGGTVTVVPSDNEVTFWVNDEGKILGFPVNWLATDSWIRWDSVGCVLHGDWLAGPVVVTGGATAAGSTRDLPDRARRWILSVARDAGAEIDPRVLPE